MIEEFIHSVTNIPQRSQASELSQTPRQLDQVDQAVIDNTNRNFKGQQKQEIVLCFTRRHWIVLLPHIIGFTVFFLILASFFLFISDEDIAQVTSPFYYRIVLGLVLAGFTFYIHRFFIKFLNYYLQILIITNFRIIKLDQTLYFQHVRDSIDLREIQDIVALRSGIFKTILNYGELIITLSSAHASKSLYCIPNPEYYFRKINKTKREYIINRRLTT